MYDWSINDAVRTRVRSAASALRERPTGPYDAVVTHSEVNDRHGTGVLIQRLFPDARQVVSIRAVTHWNGEQTFGARQLIIPYGIDRASIYRWTLEATKDLRIGRIVCVPFSSAEIIAAIALHDALAVPLCLYLMDDQNVVVQEIPDDVKGEAIEKATVRLAISSDMRDAYETKYARRFWIAPPTIPTAMEPTSSSRATAGTAVMVGNVWGRSWFEALRETVRASGLRVDWFANSPNAGWLNLPSHEELERDGIRLRAPLAEDDLAERLGDYEVALMPSVPADGERENAAVAMLSLPSRVPLLLGASDLPIIVLGDEASCVARFVRHFSLGRTCRYDGSALSDALGQVRDPQWRAIQAESLSTVRELLSGHEISSWLGATLDAGHPPTEIFEALTVRPRAMAPRHIDAYPPLGPWLHAYEPMYAAFRRLAAAGYRPDFVIDVGASTGVWSHVLGRVFPNADFLLVDPLYSRHNQVAARHYFNSLRRVKVCEAAVGATEQRAVLHVDPGLYNASLMSENAIGGPHERVEVDVRTLDSIASQFDMRGRGLLKLDIQGGELPALRGARRLLEKAVDIVVAEATPNPLTESVPSLADLDSHLCEAGFVWYDDVGGWREPASGTLLEKDVLYVRNDGPFAAGTRGSSPCR